MAELFIKISGIIILDPEEVKLVVDYSNSNLIEKYLNKYLNFYRTYQTQLELIPNL